LPSNIKKKVIEVLDSFFFLLEEIWKKNPIICFCLLLDPKFKTFQLVSSFIDQEQGKAIFWTIWQKVFVSFAS
jgi:hypothetical protein